jgi:polyisoprenoid-binding protein YceI
MKQHYFTSLAAAAAGLLAACSDPADNVHKTSASSPQKAGSGSSASGTEYVIRGTASTIGFVGSKVTGSHTGGFKNFAGKISADGGKIVGTPEIKINMQSTWADNPKLTGHLKSRDFFDVENFPVTTFTVTSVESSGTDQKFTGNLNLHGVTKSISFPANVQTAHNAITVKAEFAINRKDFNINYPGKPNDLIRDNVVIKLDIKATPGAPGPEDQIAN